MNIYINGVQMLPKGFPLTVVSPDGEYLEAKGDLEPVSNFFAYSKSIPAKTKVDQEVLDEFYRLIIGKTQYSFRPTLINNTSRDLGVDIFDGGKIIKGINPDKLGTLMDPTGVTASEAAIFDMIKRMIDEKSNSPTLAGQATSGQETATKINAIQREQMLKMGIVMIGAINLKKQVVKKCIHTISTYWTDPVGKEIVEIEGKAKQINKYRSIMVDGSEDGESMLNVIEFNPDKANRLSSEQIDAENKMLGLKYGKKVKKRYLNPDLLKTMMIEWKINIVPTSKDEDKLKAELLKKTVSDIQVLSPGRVNMDYALRKIVMLSGEDPDKLLVSGGMGVNPMEQMMMQAQGGGQGQELPPVGQNGNQNQQPGKMAGNQVMSMLNKQI